MSNYLQKLLLLVAAATITSSATAADVVPGQLDRAVLLVVSRDWTFRVAGGESDLPSRGCRYELDSAAVAPLVDILSKAEFAADEATPNYSLFMGIYLYGRDGGTTKLLIGKSTGDVRGTLDGKPIVAKAPFDSAVRALVAKMVPTEAHYQCEGDASMRLPQT
jgi:hypothetical protein